MRRGPRIPPTRRGKNRYNADVTADAPPTPTGSSAPSSAPAPGTHEALLHQRQVRNAGRIEQWTQIAAALDERGLGWGAGYHRRLASVYRFLVPEGSRVLELGCARGDLLAALKPRFGVGVDFCPAMLASAKRRHPALHFHEADCSAFDPADYGQGKPFDYIILSDLINELPDVQATLEAIRSVCAPHTRVILNTYSRVWEPILNAASVMGLARPMTGLNWLTAGDTRNLLDLAGFEALRTWQEVLWPLNTPGLRRLCNRALVKLSPINHLALSNFIIARPQATPIGTRRADDDRAKEPVVSVIVAARNESGNIDQIIRRTPQMGGGTELIFVEGNSSDDTWAKLQSVAPQHADWGAGFQIMQQDGKGKGDAVRKGFAAATGDVLMILDADMTVPPEDLPRFYEALRSGRGEYINGVRLVYPMEDEAMRFFNLLGNKAFSLAFTWLLGQPIKDTLCGTKVMTKQNYDTLAANRHYFGDFDPFGDFDLIFGAAKMNLKMIDLPIRYQARTYGDTNIQRWRSGVILLRMTMYAARRLKFV